MTPSAGRSSREEGFTLVELLLVIVISGILAAVVVTAVQGINERTRGSACRADVHQVEVASEAYRAQRGTFASAIDDAGHSATTLVGAKLLREAPETGNAYTIAYDAADGSVTASPACDSF